MIGNILLFLLFIFLAGIFIIILLVRNLLRASGLDQLFHLFGQRPGGNTRHQGSTQRQQNPEQRHTTTATGEVIIDRRTAEEANQKIFHQDEGEYVDYKEE